MEKMSSKETTFLPKMYKRLAFAAMTHLAGGLCLSAPLTLKVENSLICLAGTRIPTVTVWNDN
jgi:hypothetical protein